MSVSVYIKLQEKKERRKKTVDVTPREGWATHVVGQTNIDTVWKTAAGRFLTAETEGYLKRWHVVWITGLNTFLTKQIFS